MVAIGATVSFVVFLYDLTFMHDFLHRYPEYVHGWEHVLFYTLANALDSVLAFASVALFFKACEKLPEAVGGGHQLRHT
jgi:hypothetical protein